MIGGEERLGASVLGLAAGRAGQQFTRGSFWKRFDAAGKGEVVNYDLHWLPGKPVLREVDYPNDGRRYFRKGDKVILLNYSNEPYRIVYDTMKAIDENNVIGVMHLGQFPDGIEFATFTMARHNYPFEQMSVEDFHLLAADPAARIPGAADLAGNWEGRLITLARPANSLLTRANPVGLTGSLASNGGLSFRLAGVDLPWSPGALSELRLIGPDVLIGRCHAGVELAWLAALQSCVEPQGGKFWLYFVVTRRP